MSVLSSFAASPRGLISVVVVEKHFKISNQEVKHAKEKKNKKASALLNFLVKVLVVKNLSWWPKIPQVLVF